MRSGHVLSLAILTVLLLALLASAAHAQGYNASAPAAAMVVAEGYVFVVFDGTLYQFTVDGLQEVAKVNLAPKGKAGAKGWGAAQKKREALGTQLKQAIAAGQITEEQAKARWNAYLGQESAAGELNALGSKLKAAVAAGEMTEEQAKAQFEQARKKLSEQGEQK